MQIHDAKSSTAAGCYIYDHHVFCLSLILDYENQMILLNMIVHITHRQKAYELQNRVLEFAS